MILNFFARLPWINGSVRLHLLLSLFFVFQSWTMGQSPEQTRQSPANSIKFSNLTEQSGISFVHSNGSSGQGYLVEGVLGGMATLDYNNDGLVDIFFTNGKPLKGSTESPGSKKHALYRNRGNFQFEDVSEEAGLDLVEYGMGAIAADYDNDDDQDLFVMTFGKNRLMRNDGKGHFEDVSAIAGISNRSQVSAGACFVDVDNDGLLDLFVATYVDFTYENHVPFPSKGEMLLAGPQYYPYLPHSLFRNLGNGTFEDISVASGIAKIKGPGMGVVAGDFDDDADQDIFVAQDGVANLLFQNDGKGNFEETALLAGVASNNEGKIHGSMGVDCADYDNDGKLDLFVTNYQSEIPVLYHNLGNGLFEDVSRRSKIPNSFFPLVNWGTCFADFDADGHRDIYVANGHFDRVEKFNQRSSLKVANTLLWNNRRGEFSDVSAFAGDGLGIVESSRGIAVDDLDNDGDLDLIVLNVNAKPSILRNDSPNQSSHWLKLKLRGILTNRDGIGARVTIRAGNRLWIDEVRSGRGYQSDFGRSLHFGLGEAPNIEEITIRWPSKIVETMRDVPADQLIQWAEKQ